MYSWCLDAGVQWASSGGGAEVDEAGLGVGSKHMSGCTVVGTRLLLRTAEQEEDGVVSVLVAVGVGMVVVVGVVVVGEDRASEVVLSLVVVGVVVVGVGIDEAEVVEVVVTISTAVGEIAVVDEDELDEGVIIVVPAEAMVLGVGVAEEGSLQSPSAAQVDPILSTGAAEGQSEIEGEEFRG